jgi:beta-galactosidase
MERRDFLKSAVATGAVSLIPDVGALSLSLPDVRSNSTRLSSGWEFCREGLGSTWDVWRNDPGNNILWKPVQLPHCFNERDAVDPDQPYYEGPCWYRTKLKIENPFPNGRTLLHFEGAGQKTQVFVYTDKATEHIGGYDEFVVDITELAKKFLASHSATELPVAILCDNSRDSEMIPSGLNDFHRYGGLYRHLNLVYAPAISLQHIHVDAKTNADGRGRVVIRSRLYNPDSRSEPISVRIRVSDSHGSIIHTAEHQLVPWTGETELTAFDVAKPDLWSPDKTTLYLCEVTLTSALGNSTEAQRFGFRYFDFLPHGPFQLNGDRLLLRGTQFQEDHAGVGAAVPDEIIWKQLNLIKKMGANFVRLGHYQQSRNVLDLCDALGLLVWEEIPWSRGGLGGEKYKQQARDMLQNMIDQHYNHPSIIIWGLGNENDWPGDFPEYDKEAVCGFVKELNALAHKLDPSRKTALRRCDFCKDAVDVYSPSIWAGWYHGRYTRYRELCEQQAKEISHFLHMEWGGESHAGRHSEEPDRLLAQYLAGQSSDAKRTDVLLSGGQDHAPTEGDWSETYVCNLFDWHLKEQENMPWLAGSAQWAFKDFATPLRPNNPIAHVNQKGLVQRDLTLKEGYYVFQSYWSAEPMVHIYGHSWPVRWGGAEEKKLVKVYSNCDSVELFLNGVSCGVRRRNSQDYPAAGLHWLENFKAGGNHLRAVGSRNEVTIADEIRFQYETGNWGRPAQLEVKQLPRELGRVTVEVRLLDADGRLCLDARNRVRFAVGGNAILLDNLGTPGGSRSVELWNGRAEISVQSQGGRAVVSVSCERCPTAFAVLG